MVAISALVAAGASVALLGLAGLAVVAAASAGSLAAGLWVSRRLGGLTGDVYGALTEAVEAATFLGMAAAANEGWISAWALG